MAMCISLIVNDVITRLVHLIGTLQLSAINSICFARAIIYNLSVTLESETFYQDFCKATLVFEVRQLR